jgi:hypothetical protein
MNTFERWYMKRIIKKEIVQGKWHFARTEAMMTMIIDAWRTEFNEDNLPTTKAILHECLESAIEKANEN